MTMETAICKFKNRDEADPIPATLPFPTRNVSVHHGYVEEYIIPEDQKEAVLALLYPFTNVPSLNKVMIDIHEDKKFRVRDYKVIQGPDRPFLMSPYWETSGGSVIDWFPAPREGRA